MNYWKLLELTVVEGKGLGTTELKTKNVNKLGKGVSLKTGAKVFARLNTLGLTKKLL